MARECRRRSPFRSRAAVCFLLALTALVATERRLGYLLLEANSRYAASIGSADTLYGDEIAVRLLALDDAARIDDLFAIMQVMGAAAPLEPRPPRAQSFQLPQLRAPPFA